MSAGALRSSGWPSGPALRLRAISPYDAAVALGFALFAVVRVEPAPSDAIFACVIAAALATGRLELRALPRGPLICIGAFAALNLLACVQVVDAGRAAKFVSITFYLLAFALWVSAWMTSRERARTLLQIYLVGAAVSAVLGSVALFVHVPGRSVLTAYEGTRARALFKDPNVLGPFLVPAALILMHEIFEPRLLRWGRLTKLAVLAVLIAGVLFSYSRAAWLNLAVGVVVMGALLWLRPGGRRRALVFGAVLALVVATVVVSIEVTGQLSFLKERAHFQTYDSQRFGVQSKGISLGEHNLLGVGPGQFEAHEPISAHSTYIRTWAEEGPAGLAVLLVLLLGTGWLALRNALRGRDTYGIAPAALVAAWCGILVNSVFVDTLHWRHLWLVAGLIWAAGRA